MLLLLFSGTKTSAAPVLKVTKCGFQTNAFQRNAFQNCAKTAKVGWPDTLRRKVPRKDLERLLQLQKDSTFGPRWFEEFEAAQEKFAKDEGRAALAEAAKEARRAAELIGDGGILGSLGSTLQVAAETKHYELATEIAQSSRRYREAYERWQESDDELALMALFGGIEPKTDDDDEAILVLLH